MTFEEQILRHLQSLEQKLAGLERRIGFLERKEAVSKDVAREGQSEAAPAVDRPEAIPPSIERPGSKLETLRGMHTSPPEAPAADDPNNPELIDTAFGEAAIMDATGADAGPGSTESVQAETVREMLPLPREREPRPAQTPVQHKEPAPTARQKPTLESLIGGRWFAVAGAIAVLVAIVLFLKLAYDQGWLGRLPPALRCGIGAAFGVALLGTGEVARRKINAWAAVGLLSAGVAGLYSSVLAAYGMYHLFGDAVAFALLATVSAVGIATGARSRLPVVSIVSLVGAYLAPFLLDTPDPSPLVFPSYTLAILGTGLTLGSLLRGGFRVVGALVWWGTLLLGGLWISSQGEAHSAIAMTYAGLAWLMVHAGHIYATRPPERDSEEPDTAWNRSWREAVPLHQVWMLGSSFSFSTWATMLCVWIAEQTGVMPNWAPPAVLATVTATVAFVLIPSLKLLREVPHTGRERLGTALLAQTGGLVIAVIALATTGVSAVPSWLALGLAAIVGGRLIRSRAMDTYGVLAMLIGTVRLVAYDRWQPELSATTGELLGLVLSKAMFWAISVGVGWVVAAIVLLWRLPHQTSAKPRPLAAFAMGTAFLVLMSSVLHEQAQGTSIAIAWAVLASAGMLLSGFGRRMALTEISLGALVLPSAKVLFFDAVDNFQEHYQGNTWGGLVFTPWMAACLMMCLACLIAAMLAPARLTPGSTSQRASLWIGRLATGLGVMFAMIAAFHPEALGTSVAIAWMLLGMLAILLAPMRPGMWLEFMGLMVLGAMLFRLVAVDGLLGLPSDGIAWHGLFLTRWCLAMALGGGAWLLAGLVLSFRVGSARIHERMPFAAGAAGVFMIGASLLHPEATMTSILWAWIALGVGALAASPLRRDMKLNWTSAGVACVCVMLWIIAHVIPDFDWTNSTAIAFLHPGLWSALCLAGLIVWLAARGLGDVSKDELTKARFVSGWTTAFLVWAATSLEVARVGTMVAGDRAVQLAIVSIWWAVFSVGLIGGGFRWKVGIARRAGLGLMGIAALKVVLYDMGGVSQAWRIASFLLLGLLMIGIAAGYSRVANRLFPKGQG